MREQHRGYTVIIPCLNEQDNIGDLVQELRKDVAANVIVVDNYSEDATCEVAQTAGAYIREFIGDLTPEQRLLSVGCGSSPVLNQWTCKKFGMDINPAKIAFFKDHTDAELKVGDITKGGIGPYSVSSIDALICNAI